MKLINGYWTDENNNRWNASIYSCEEAAENSESLAYCRDCENCKNCRFCTGCESCYDCTNCNDCRYCTNCEDCVRCDFCKNCLGCFDFEDNPQIYRTRRIGSRNKETTFYYGKTKTGMEVQVICGCFLGGLEAFERAVEKTHGNNKHGKDYRREIEKVKALFDLDNEKGARNDDVVR